MTRAEAHAEYRAVMEAAGDETELLYVMRRLALGDLFFLLVYACGKHYVDNDWGYQRCRDIQRAPFGHLDLWAREHLKSTIITFGLVLQCILADPETTAGIFSFTRPIAKQFLRQIMRELESNELLQKLFPDRLWESPRSQAPKWSENDGIILRREGNPKESTVEAWGLVDGQPTSKHFMLMVYDDTVSRESVTNAEQIAKTTRAWEDSLNLSARGGEAIYVGTFWHHADTYHTMIERGIPVRKYPGTADGTEEGEPVYLSAEEIAEKRRMMGRYVFSCQILLNPQPESMHSFRPEWRRSWPARMYANLNLYILVDPAHSKKKGSDYSVFTVVGLGSDRNYYVVTWVRGRLNLTERTNTLIALHQEYRPVGVGYERYGLQSDIEHIQFVQEQVNYRFSITELGGALSKPDRVERMIPDFEAGRWYLPESCIRAGEEGAQVDLRKEYDREYEDWPFPLHDDMLDCQSRIYDMNAVFPAGDERNALKVGAGAGGRKYDPRRFGMKR